MALHELEKKVLLALEKKHRQTREEIVAATGLDPASVDHAAGWLSGKGMVRTEDKIEERVELGDEGRDFLKHKLPERRALELIHHGKSSLEVLNRDLGAEVMRIANVWLIREGLAKLENGSFKLTDKGKEYLNKKLPHEAVIESIGAGRGIPTGFEQAKKELEKRGRILHVKELKGRTIELMPEGKSEISKGIKDEKEVSQLTPEMIVTGKWKDVKIREYDVKAPVVKVYPGRRHFVNQAMDYVRKIWLEMGFKEMTGPIIDTSFWVFDSLFVPQEHPAREMQDTLFVKPGMGDLPDDKIVKKVKGAHEVGTHDSLGWSYKWSPEIAKKLLLRTHTTVLSAKTLASLKKEDWPAKHFAIGRVFRNETLDWKHLFEFSQVEGIVVDENANFSHLIGYLREFYNKLGFEKARFVPSYFPYTEPSLEIQVWHPVRKEWVELGGAGIFRPEVTEPLLGEPVPVLAWGPGFDRIIMDYYKIKDIRELYRNDVRQLREMKQWML
jgi:phenylalanyl-tRNA synthetase alpha chain